VLGDDFELGGLAQQALKFSEHQWVRREQADGQFGSHSFVATVLEGRESRAFGQGPWGPDVHELLLTVRAYFPGFGAA